MSRPNPSFSVRPLGRGAVFLTAGLALGVAGLTACQDATNPFAPGARPSAVIGGTVPPPSAGSNPSIGELSGVGGPIALQPGGTPVTVTATVADQLPARSTTFTAWVTCGDGSPAQLTPVTMSGDSTGSRGTVTATCTYPTAGVYTPIVTVTDGPNTTSRPSTTYVVVYDPGAGFVTGGGWIVSPAGAYPADPSLGGRANFGFVAKYQKGASVPTGQTEFQFQAGRVDFHSTDYQWLVVAGSRAQYKGTGTINGAGRYGFLLTAIDGRLSGGQDGFRLKITDGTGAVVYDNQLGQTDTGTSTTALAGGSITIHGN